MVELYEQQDEELNERLAFIGSLDKYGCYVCSIVNGIMTVTRKQISRDKVVEVCTEAFRSGWVEKDHFIANPNNFVKLFDNRFWYGGFGSPRDQDNKEFAVFSIECWKDSRKKYKHFKLAHFDSYRGGTITNRNGWVDSYRVFCSKI